MEKDNVQETKICPVCGAAAEHESGMCNYLIKMFEDLNKDAVVS